jgi:hypothetical protein
MDKTEDGLIIATLNLSLDGKGNVPGVFTFRSEDPFSVQLVMHIWAGTQVELFLDREQLIRACHLHTGGDGLPEIWPQDFPDNPCTPKHAGVYFCVATSDGKKTFHTPLMYLLDFLMKTEFMVPLGAESEAFAGELDEFLDSTRIIEP